MSKRRNFTPNERKTIYTKYNGHCAICGRPVKYNDMTIDHIKPLSKGGANEMENLELCCWECNHVKGNMDITEFYQKVSEIFIHNWKKIATFHAKQMFVKGGVEV